jgi:cytochrome c oxidase assembly protein subunit 11
MANSNKNGAMYALSAVFGVLGCAYLGVPFYSVLCNSNGIGGIPKSVKDSIDAASILLPKKMQPYQRVNRPLSITFHANNSKALPWRFTPLQKKIVIQPGESALAFFRAENLSKDRSWTGISTYNISPEKCAVYFNKIQCFCFEEQRLEPGEAVDMPVFFYVDKEIVTDTTMDDVEEILLSYTFFPAQEQS